MCSVTIVCAVTRLRPGPGPWYAAAQSSRVESGPVFHLFPAFSRVSAPLYAAGEEGTDTAYRPSRDQINSAISSPLTRVLCAMMSSDNKPQGPGIQPPSLSCTAYWVTDMFHWELVFSIPRNTLSNSFSGRVTHLQLTSVSNKTYHLQQSSSHKSWKAFKFTNNFLRLNITSYQFPTTTKASTGIIKGFLNPNLNAQY